MDDMRFADIMQRERERLNCEREEILNQQKDLENKLTEINREFAAIDAYEAAKTGKAATPSRQPRAPRKSDMPIKQLSVDNGARPETGTRREAILKLLKKIRAVSVEAKSLNVSVSRGTNPRRSRCPMP